MHEETRTFRLLRGTHGRFEGPAGNQVDTLYRVGDLIELTDEQARSMGARVELVDDEAHRTEEPQVMNVKSTIAAINACNTLEDLEEFEQAERMTGKPRVMVMRAIDNRRAELATEMES